MKLLKIQGDNDLYAKVDDDIYDEICDLKWYIDKNFVVKLLNTPFTKLHVYIKGKSENLIDHKDRDKLNNQRENLRYCTKSQNGSNQDLAAHNTSGYKGVSFNNKRKRFKATIQYQNKTIHLGWFKIATKAHNAYVAKSIELFKEFSIYYTP